MKSKIAEYSEDISRWEKVTYRTADTGEQKRKAVRGKRSVLFIDTAAFRRMLDPLGLAANRIAYMIMDECDFGTNIYNGTYEEIGDSLHMSRGSVIKGMKELLMADFIRKYRNGRWMLSPDVGTKCYAEDIDKLRDVYFSQRPYTPKEERKDDKYEVD